MGRRWGLGPVFVLECRLRARRGHVYAARAAVVLAILVGLFLIWMPSGYVAYRRVQIARIGANVFLTIVTVQMVAVLLVAPATAASAICVDKVRGTLLHMLVTDLREREVVVDKLAARLAPVLSLVLCGLPVLALCSLLGGIDVVGAVGAFLATAGVAVVGCALGLLFSVWARRVHQALIPTYAALGVWLGLQPVLLMVLGRWLGFGRAGLARVVVLTSPFGIVWGRYQVPPVGLREQAAFLIVCLVVGAALAGVAARRLRAAAVGQASRPARRGRPGIPARVVGLLPEPPLDGNPVLWREWHRKRPSRWTGRFWVAYGAASGLGSAAVLYGYYLAPGRGSEVLAAYVNAWGVAIGLLLLSVSAATSLAEERDRGSLDVVLATPLPTRTVVWGKWWGTFAMVPRLLIFPAWVVCGLAMVTGRVDGAAWMIGLILAYAAAITSIGLAAATWVPRPGRAVVNSVLAYAMLTVGSVLLVEAASGFLLGRGRRTEVQSKVLLINPFYGVLTATRHAGSLRSYGPYYGGPTADFLGREPVLPLLAMAGYAAAAAVVLQATIGTFDRCLGRVSERPHPPPETGPGACCD